jgi:hypothetical protein
MELKSFNEEFVQTIRQMATDIGARVISTLVNGSDKVPTAFLEPDDFIGLFHRSAARVVYVMERRFGAEIMAMDQIEENESGIIDTADFEDDVKQYVGTTPEFQSLVTRWTNYDDLLCSVTAVFMMDGIMHIIIRNEAWLSEFEEDADRILETLQQHLDDRRQKDQEMARREMVAKARTLANHPQFSAAQPSVAKQEALARLVFPEAEDWLVKQIVNEAAALVWLQQDGEVNASDGCQF